MRDALFALSLDRVQLRRGREAMSAASFACAVCGEKSFLKCGACRRVSYCTKDHQRLDWKAHKAECTPAKAYRVEQDERVGRHLVAERDIQQGEVVLEEAALVSGPLQATPPVCLGCYVLLSEFNSRRCSRCGWPVCSLACESSAAHEPECRMTETLRRSKVSITTFGVPHPSYAAVTVLRCLHLKETNQEVWGKIGRLESHAGSEQGDVAEFIPRFFDLGRFDVEEIRKISGILRVNAHHVPLAEPGYASVYDEASFLEHDCFPNCSKSFTGDGKVSVRAARSIVRGEHLSISYTEPLWGTEARKRHLLETKSFVCQCRRCTDPTELGTRFDSLRCTTPGCDGFADPDPTASQPTWRCETCRTTFGVPDFADVFLTLRNALVRLDRNNPESCEGFVTESGRYLHPNHHIGTDVKLCQIRCYDRKRLTEATEEELSRLVVRCRDLIELSSRLVPAENRLRGILHVHLHAALEEADRRRSLAGDMDAERLVSNLQMRKEILEAAYGFLKYEPEMLPEGKMAVEALKHVREINVILGRSQLGA